MSSRHNARKAAIQALYQWDLTGQEANEIESSFVQIHDMQNVDKRYLRMIIDGVPGNATALQAMIEPIIERPFKALDPVERGILRLGAYELRFLTDVPTRVVLNELIDLAKVFGSDKSYKFVNSVMDKLAKSERKA